MPTSSAMPEVVVQIAWDGGFRVPMADWTWTDVSDYVELEDNILISWGRGDERSTADASTLTLTLDNSEGRFTAARSTSPYYPNVVLYKPIRVLATPVDGSEVPLFTGYVTSWPVEWEDIATYAKASITASSRLARLGLNARWRSIIEEATLTDSPIVYYPLGDPEGSTSAADASGNGAAPLVMIGAGTPVVFGQATGPGTDDLTAATFAGDGPYLTGGAIAAALPEFTAEAFVLVPEPPKKLEPIFALVVGGITIAATLNTAGEVDVRRNAAGGTPTSVATSSVVADGLTHHVAVTVTSGGAVTLYVDGASADTGAIAAVSGAAWLDVGGTPEYAGLLTNGVVAHVAVFSSVLSAARIAAHATAGADAWASETTAERFERYANLAGIDSAEVSTETGSTTVGHIDTTGAQVVDMLRLMEATEAGVMFDDRDGTLTLHSRSHRYAATAAVTLDMAKHEVEADYSPRLDASALVNDITVTGVTTAYKVDKDSIEANGLATASLVTASEDDDEPLNLAGWALLQFANPKTRVPTLAVNATAQAASFDAGTSSVSSAAVIGVTIGDKVTVANHPQQAAVSISDYIVEGGTFAIAPESFGITWNVSPSSPDDTALVWGDTIQGVWGTNAWAL